MDIPLNGQPHKLRPLSMEAFDSFGRWAEEQRLAQARARAMALPHQAADILAGAYDEIEAGEVAKGALDTAEGLTYAVSLSLGLDAATVRKGLPLWVVDSCKSDILAALLAAPEPESPSQSDLYTDQQERRRAIFAAMREEVADLEGLDDAALSALFQKHAGVGPEAADPAKIRARLKEVE